MRDTADRHRTLKDLRFALDVLEERSHIGLDDKTAGTIKSVLLHQIVETERALNSPSSAQVEMTELSAEEQLTA